MSSKRKFIEEQGEEPAKKKITQIVSKTLTSQAAPKHKKAPAKKEKVANDKKEEKKAPANGKKEQKAKKSRTKKMQRKKFLLRMEKPKTMRQSTESCEEKEARSEKLRLPVISINGIHTSILSEETPSITPHRPWVDILNVTAFTGSSCPDSGTFCDRSVTVKDGMGRDREMCSTEAAGSSEDRFSDRPNCCWFRGRRARTAFTRNQIEVLEEEFQLNCYPGIDVREELAQKLTLDEDRIQIWFQNRRAKLKRSRRESQFLMVKNALSSSVQKQKVVSQL
ncbi:hypothetical protein scyTo_0001971 [Scyliorhinus torazame]|uniref:Homeobox domain-containing protein n=1 Tax=Scyliorhinus torazame TaxID=75743 RepID=A0A401PGZ0_SCYTO|nr:hypothetical protein [Scyliorhinus torazame]